MIVRIVKCSKPSYWYAHSIGAEIYVILSVGWGDKYMITTYEFERVEHLFPKATGLYIDKSDCEIIEQ